MIRRLLPGILIICVMGCGQRAYEIPDSGATLEGSVTYDGKPVPMALIVVRSETATADARIVEPGKYKVPSVPIGKVKIAVDTDAMRGELMSRSMAQAYKGPGGQSSAEAGKKLSFIAVPGKFADPDSSGITFEIKKGANTFDIVIPR
ncbi:MAG: hypothetical protein RL595_3301 [Planctomycetota bacterium]|jgi:hypothetical protein